ncbi:ImmA/IrrE family metallo-endopeptidase [Clostridium zeae]|uniref:ImmA/IrrE family metallo-endopeptidase n=2 Tax=Clostridium TaxID=1485 RepID=A0ABS1EJA1_9CLOT|nr:MULTISPECIES: ImmA/IrrE family metallo-endopeptidase [Clostridium]MBK1809449.1 ImmA/IrrE family metallo-endopeptidase [Clostridium yunnanense]GFZ30747.1 ImmA/IrrE family metallo-endopeptidase [Clostridium zeae]
MQWIDNIVLGLVDEYGTRDVYELCDCLEIEIRGLDPSSIILNGHEAFYYRHFNGAEIIFISNKLENPLKEFVLKHELGHALCHTGILSAGFLYSNIHKLEKQANYFAFKLSDISFDKVELREMTLEQIASCLEIPYEPLKQLVNL